MMLNDTNVSITTKYTQPTVGCPMSCAYHMACAHPSIVTHLKLVKIACRNVLKHMYP